MSRNPKLKEALFEEICKFYEAQSEKLIDGVQLYRHKAILTMASKKFYLTPDYIERIVSGNTGTPKEPVDPNQISMFNEEKENEKVSNKNNQNSNNK